MFFEFVLYCISDPANGDPSRLAAEVARRDVDFFQFRHKSLPDDERLRMALEVAAVPRPSTRLLIHGNMELARRTFADGIHLSAGTMSIEAARRELPGKCVGVSVHSLGEAVEAAAHRPDYLLLAPVFAPISKGAYRTPLGLKGLREVCEAVSVPVIALGGMTIERFAEVLENGAAGVAGITLFADLAALERVTEQFRAASKARRQPARD